MMTKHEIEWSVRYWEDKNITEVGPVDQKQLWDEDWSVIPPDAIVKRISEFGLPSNYNHIAGYGGDCIWFVYEGDISHALKRNLRRVSDDDTP